MILAREASLATFVLLGPATPSPAAEAPAVRPLYASNVLIEDGTGTFVLPTALDDPPGRWRVKVTDLLSGASAGAEVELR